MINARKETAMEMRIEPLDGGITRISLAGRTDRLSEGLDRLSQALNSY